MTKMNLYAKVDISDDATTTTTTTTALPDHDEEDAVVGTSAGGRRTVPFELGELDTTTESGPGDDHGGPTDIDSDNNNNDNGNKRVLTSVNRVAVFSFVVFLSIAVLAGCLLDSWTYNNAFTLSAAILGLFSCAYAVPVAFGEIPSHYGKLCTLWAMILLSFLAIGVFYKPYHPTWRDFFFQWYTTGTSATWASTRWASTAKVCFDYCREQAAEEDQMLQWRLFAYCPQEVCEGSTSNCRCFWGLDSFHATGRVSCHQDGWDQIWTLYSMDPIYQYCH
mmetsp:Transcript_3396/g.9424  ORF Transcript_3396/g.9424 Transcript_3396/m.9424 type:complete len:278 (-) Transcript_3396:1518-2351(-)